MSLVAPVTDGKIESTTSKTSSTEKTSNSTLDKEAFLSLLICEMQNQDPLEPTSNTEYISQLATFSSLEEMQNMAASMDNLRASGLVGQEVYLKSTNSTTGETNYIHGIVDYIQMSGSDVLLSVNGSLYPLSDLDSVYDQTYSTAYNMAYNWNLTLNQLPAVSKISEANRSAIEGLRASYEKMDDYQKTFITSENLDKLAQYEEQLAILKAIQDSLNNASGNTTSNGNGTSTDTSSSTATDEASEETLSDEQLAALTE